MSGGGLTKRGRWGFAGLVILVILAGTAFNKRLTAQETRKGFKVGLAVLRDNPDYNTAKQSFVDVLEKENDMTVEFKRKS
ncbi:MAG: hypothetical protein KJ893_00030 [Candidatus Omnitrophica bacterium]|nr:hypothetical protein [Candidatus Omnitrophota bacterium]MBU4479549.1 hypothetical protein [Candidatus Omnitrophota bacterium]MCG2702894.1 hypothetical protein [Candidatus Omnitrophota bacterium]